MSFRWPAWPGTLLAIALVTGFSALGQWQLDRAADKQLRIEQFETASRYRGLPAPDQVEDGAQVEVEGRFDPERHVLADNQVWQGRPGVHVYSLFRTGGTALLVNRGWLPLGARRDELPDVVTPEGPLALHGRLSGIPAPGRQLGEALAMHRDRWPQLVTYPSLERISEALGEPLYARILLLDENSPGGFDARQWKAVYLSPQKHRAYAFQWFALAAASLCGWLFFAIRSAAGAPHDA